MTETEKLFSAEPQNFVRYRSMTKTIVGMSITVVFLGAALVLILNYAVFSEWSLSGPTSGSRYNSAGAQQLGTVGTPVLAAIIGGVALWYTIAHAKTWQRVATGSRVRGLREYPFQASRAAVTQLAVRVASNVVGSWLPLPPRAKEGAALVDVWVADADRTAFVVVSHRQKGDIFRSSLIMKTEAEYDEIVAAAKRGFENPVSARVDGEIA